MNKTAIIYVRKSNEDKGKNAIRAQLERCRKYAQQLGAEIVAELIDENVKGTVPISERPEGSKIAQIHADMVIMRDGTASC